LGAKVVLISFVAPERMGDWLTKQSMPADAFLMLGDGSDTKKIYRAYGMQACGFH
ncbi:hypothetical protein SARC_09132, partial [Sphaeroforma arctica JP610]